MFEITGKYNRAVVYSNKADEGAAQDILTLCNQPFTYGSKIRIMPDYHKGAGCVIGTTMTITDKVVANLVGVDIGCGMHVAELSSNSEVDLEKLDKVIHKCIPSGFAIRNQPHRFIMGVNLQDLFCYDKINVDRATKSIGTLGGGNHFIEVDENDGKHYLVIHTGSRNLGKQVAEYYQNLAFEYHKTLNDNQKQSTIDLLKSSHMEFYIQNTMDQFPVMPPKALCYLEGELMDQYLHDMEICQLFAHFNRLAIADVIISMMDWNCEDCFSTIHNYIDLDNMILRKGAVSARFGEKLIIPINMRDGSIIAMGKGNPEWNKSAPHGAGRLLARGEAKRSLRMEDFENSMQGIYTTCVAQATIDESPMAYKSMDEIIENTKDTIEIFSIIKPIYNFKAAE